MTRFLFVYGTLRKGIGHPMAEFLAQRARFVGAARMTGRLFDLGPYPGMLPAESAHDWVQGDLFELRDPEVTLEALDRYESLASRPPLFVREVAEALTSSEERISAWAYYYRGPMEGARRIACGNYRREPAGPSPR